MYKNSRLIIALSFLVLVSACSRNNIKPGEIPNLPPVASQNDVGRSLGAVQNKAYKENTILVNSGASFDRVKRIMDRLAVAAGMDSYRYPIFVAENPDPRTANAFIYSGTTVVVYSALINKVRSDEELAAVLAHETGHMLGRHHEDKTEEERAGVVSIVGKVLGYTLGAIAAVGAKDGGVMARRIANGTYQATTIVGQGAFVKSYSRDKEREADSIGLTLMAKAGYDPRAAVGFWRRANQVFGGGASIAFLSTHPSHEDRAQDLESQLDVAFKFYKKPVGKTVDTAQPNLPLKKQTIALK